MALAAQLNLLESADLIRLAQAQPELEYLFRHALIQDAAYRSLVKQDRRQLHLAVGEALERMYLEDPAGGGIERLTSGELAALLGRHFDEAGDHRRALKYYALAGDAAARIYANTEAVAHYAQALDIAKRLTDTSADLLRHLYLSRGQALELNGQHTEALSDYAEMERLAQQRGDRALQLVALMARAKIHATLNLEQNPAQAQQLLEQSLSLARDLGDRAAECKVRWNLMNLLLWSGGDQRQAVAYGEQALALARELNLREQLAFTLNDLSYAYMSIGDWLRVQPVLDEARELWRELSNLPMLVDNLANSVLIRFRAGEYEQAIQTADEALRVSRSINNVWGQAGSQSYIGLVYLERGEFDRAISIMEGAIQLGEQAGHPAPTVNTRSDLAWAYGMLGAIEHGLELAQLALTRAGNTPFLRVAPLAMLARLCLLSGDPSAAWATLQEGYHELKPEGLQWFALILLSLADGELALARQEHTRAISVMDSLLAHLRETQTRPFAPDALYLKGKAFLGQGREDEAQEVLIEARARAEALGSRRSLWRILIALSEIEAGRGNDAEAQSLRRRAREIVVYIADHTPVDLRATFLNLPHIRAVVQGA